MENTVFYGLAGVLVLMSVLAVSAGNLLHAAIAIIGSFFATAAIYLLFRMEFVALAQIMIYVGAIVVFMVITILLTAQLGAKNLAAKPPWQRLGGLAVALALFLALWRVTRGVTWPEEKLAATPEPASLAVIGLRLLSAEGDGFIVSFELISLLLLAALIGAVVIARRDSVPATEVLPGKHFNHEKEKA